MQPFGITSGPDANLWFVEFNGAGNSAARVTDIPAPAIVLTPNSGPPGAQVLVTGSGFGALEKIKLSFIDSVNGTTSLGKTTTDPNGAFSTIVTVPANATHGRQKIKAKGTISNLGKVATFQVT